MFLFQLVRNQIRIVIILNICLRLQDFITQKFIFLKKIITIITIIIIE